VSLHLWISRNFHQRLSCAPAQWRRFCCGCSGRNVAAVIDWSASLILLERLQQIFQFAPSHLRLAFRVLKRVFHLGAGATGPFAPRPLHTSGYIIYFSLSTIIIHKSLRSNSVPSGDDPTRTQSCPGRDSGRWSDGLLRSCPYRECSAGALAALAGY
jgi:hypothetical protein